MQSPSSLPPSERRSPPHVTTLVLMTGLALMTLNMFLPSLPAIGQTFGTDYATISWAFTGYLALSAGLQLIFGPLSDRFGRRPVLLIALTIFTVASFVAMIAQSATVFLIARMMQAAVIAGSALSQAIVRDTKSASEAASTLGYIAMAMSLAPMLGPVLGGVLEVTFGWRAVFAVYGLAGCVVLALIYADLGETNLSPSATMGQQFKTYPRLLRQPLFWGYALTAALSTGAFYVFLAGAPLVAAQSFKMPPSQLGLYIGSITAGYMFGSFLSGRLAGRQRLSSTMLLGRAVPITGLGIGVLLVLAADVPPLVFFGATLTVGIGSGIAVPAASAGAMSVDPTLAGSAAGLTGSLTVATGAVLSSITTYFLEAANGPFVVLSMMLLTTVLSLLSTLLARRHEAKLAP